jgi:transposase
VERFDELVESRCAKFYAPQFGRPSLTPGIYFRSLLIGYLRGHRGGARDCLATGGFAGTAALCGDWAGRVHAGSLDDFAHAAVDRSGHASGSCSAGCWGYWPIVDCSKASGLPLMRRRWKPTRRCVRSCGATRGRVTTSFCVGLAKASGIETPTREDLARLDRKRKKRTSNQEWKSPADEDARIAKMKASRIVMKRVACGVAT